MPINLSSPYSQFSSRNVRLHDFLALSQFYNRYPRAVADSDTQNQTSFEEKCLQETRSLFGYYHFFSSVWPLETETARWTYTTDAVQIDTGLQAANLGDAHNTDMKRPRENFLIKMQGLNLGDLKKYFPGAQQEYSSLLINPEAIKQAIQSIMNTILDVYRPSVHQNNRDEWIGPFDLCFEVLAVEYQNFKKPMQEAGLNFIELDRHGNQQAKMNAVLKMHETYQDYKDPKTHNLLMEIRSLLKTFLDDQEKNYLQQWYHALSAPYNCDWVAGKTANITRLEDPESEKQRDPDDYSFQNLWNKNHTGQSFTYTESAIFYLRCIEDQIMKQVASFDGNGTTIRCMLAVVYATSLEIEYLTKNLHEAKKKFEEALKSSSDTESPELQLAVKEFSSLKQALRQCLSQIHRVFNDARTSYIPLNAVFNQTTSLGGVSGVGACSLGFSEFLFDAFVGGALINRKQRILSDEEKLQQQIDSYYEHLFSPFYKNLTSTSHAWTPLFIQAFFSIAHHLKDCTKITSLEHYILNTQRLREKETDPFQAVFSPQNLNLEKNPTFYRFLSSYLTHIRPVSKDTIFTQSPLGMISFLEETTISPYGLSILRHFRVLKDFHEYCKKKPDWEKAFSHLSSQDLAIWAAWVKTDFMSCFAQDYENFPELLGSSELSDQDQDMMVCKTNDALKQIKALKNTLWFHINYSFCINSPSMQFYTRFSKESLDSLDTYFRNLVAFLEEDSEEETILDLRQLCVEKWTVIENDYDPTLTYYHLSRSYKDFFVAILPLLLYPSSDSKSLSVIKRFDERIVLSHPEVLRNIQNLRSACSIYSPEALKENIKQIGDLSTHYEQIKTDTLELPRIKDGKRERDLKREEKFWDYWNQQPKKSFGILEEILKIFNCSSEIERIEIYKIPQTLSQQEYILEVQATFPEKTSETTVQASTSIPFAGTFEHFFDYKNAYNIVELVPEALQKTQNIKVIYENLAKIFRPLKEEFFLELLLYANDLSFELLGAKRVFLCDSSNSSDPFFQGRLTIFGQKNSKNFLEDLKSRFENRPDYLEWLQSIEQMKNTLLLYYSGKFIHRYQENLDQANSYCLPSFLNDPQMNKFLARKFWPSFCKIFCIAVDLENQDRDAIPKYLNFSNEAGAQPVVFWPREIVLEEIEKQILDTDLLNERIMKFIFQQGLTVFFTIDNFQNKWHNLSKDKKMDLLLNASDQYQVATLLPALQLSSLDTLKEFLVQYVDQENKRPPENQGGFYFSIMLKALGMTYREKRCESIFLSSLQGMQDSLFFTWENYLENLDENYDQEANALLESELGPFEFSSFEIFLYMISANFSKTLRLVTQCDQNARELSEDSQEFRVMRELFSAHLSQEGQKEPLRKLMNFLMDYYATHKKKPALSEVLDFSKKDLSYQEIQENIRQRVRRSQIIQIITLFLSKFSSSKDLETEGDLDSFTASEQGLESWLDKKIDVLIAALASTSSQDIHQYADCLDIEVSKMIITKTCQKVQAHLRASLAPTLKEDLFQFDYSEIEKVTKLESLRKVIAQHLKLICEYPQNLASYPQYREKMAPNRLRLLQSVPETFPSIEEIQRRTEILEFNFVFDQWLQRPSAHAEALSQLLDQSELARSLLVQKMKDTLTVDYCKSLSKSISQSCWLFAEEKLFQYPSLKESLQSFYQDLTKDSRAQTLSGVCEYFREPDEWEKQILSFRVITQDPEYQSLTVRQKLAKISSCSFSGSLSFVDQKNLDRYLALHLQSLLRDQYCFPLKSLYIAKSDSGAFETYNYMNVFHRYWIYFTWAFSDLVSFVYETLSSLSAVLGLVPKAPSTGPQSPKSDPDDQKKNSAPLVFRAGSSSLSTGPHGLTTSDAPGAPDLEDTEKRKSLGQNGIN